MLSIFQPKICSSTISVPYMPNKTAEYQGKYLQELFDIEEDISPIFLEARLPVCPAESNGCTTLEHSPILLLSPGWAIPRFYYNILASAIASQGFTVITIDHPHDANIIEYPDGTTTYLNTSTWNDGNPIQDVQDRADDASFIIDQLGNATAMGELLPDRGAKPFQSKRIGMLGHSLGGAASIIAASQDSRIRGAINWDGTIFGSLPESGILQPVLLMSNGAINGSENYESYWPQMNGPKLWVTVANTTHQDFSDIPSLMQAAGLDTSLLPPDTLGSLAADRMVQILVSYTTRWMTAAFAGKGGPSWKELEGLDEFAKVSILKEGNV